MSHRINKLQLAFLAAGSLTCGGTEPGDEPQPPAAIRVVSGGAQVGTVGTKLANPIVVQVLDDAGHPASGWVITFAVTTGGGTIFPTSSQTDGDGYAATTWTIGSAAGTAIHGMTATVEINSQVSVSATASGVAGPATQIIPLRGDSQFTDLSTTLDTLSARISDRFGNYASGQDVTWSASTGVVRAVDQLSDSLGIVRAVWKTGTLSGSQSARASITGTNVGTGFTARIRPGPATGIAIYSGDQQTWAPASRLIEPLAAKAVDPYGNGVPGSPVHWTVLGGGGQLSAAISSSDSLGIARTYLTLGSGLGAQTVSAAVPIVGSAPVVFSAIASSTAGATISGVISLGSPFRPLFPGPPPSAQPSTPARTIPPSLSPRQTAGRELLVRFRASSLGVSSSGLAPTRASAELLRPLIAGRLAQAQSAGLIEVAGISPLLRTARVEVGAPHQVSEVRRRLLADPAVESVDLDSRFFLDSEDDPAGAPILDPLYPLQAWHYGMVDLPEAWQLSTGSNSVLVAVIDDGIRFDHPGIAANLTNDGYDFVSAYDIDLCDGTTVDHAGDGGGYDPDPTIPIAYQLTTSRCYVVHRQGNHGLHVAGTIGAVGNDNLGVTGVNWNIRIRPVRVLGSDGSGSEYDIAQAVLYAAGLPADDGQNGMVQAPSAARIINMSLAGAVPSATLAAAIQLAQGQNILIVASTGNMGPGSPLLYPASFPGVFAVAAVDAGGLVAGYSSRSPYVSLSAPGGTILQFNADSSTGVMSLVYDFVNGTPAYGFKRGTSMAAPHVAGAAALLLSVNPALTASQITTRLKTFAFDAGQAGWDEEYGYGVLNVRNSLAGAFPPQPEIYVRLVDTLTGRQVAQVKAGPNGMYSLPAIPDGVYYLMAGEDAGRDGRIGVPGRRFSLMMAQVFPAPPLPVALSVTGAPAYTASFTIFHGNSERINEAFVNGYSDNTIGPNFPGFQRDFLLKVPGDGRYTIETAAPKRACGYAQMSDPVLELWNISGTSLIASNDDINPALYDYCARIQLDLPAGRYVVRLKAKSAGEVKLAVREGN
jgi:subtilisin family serine protease